MIPTSFRQAMERRKKRAQKRGIALIMVLGAITILTVFLTELQTDTTAAVAGALADRDRLKAEYYAKSAVNLSRMLLASEKRIRTSPMVALALGAIFSKKVPQIPVWEFSDLVLGAFNGGERAASFGTNVSVDLSTGKHMGIPGNGYFNATIIDEDSKINVNTAAGAAQPAQLVVQLQTMFLQPQYATMFEVRDADEQFSDAPTLCAALIDWADPDENLTNCTDPTNPSTGSEDNVYQMLGLGYQRKNAPYDSLQELRLVRGMDDTRWATFVDPDVNDPHKRLLTVWGQDTSVNAINVNTANPQTLWALACSVATPETPVCSDPIQMSSFIGFFSLVRTMARGAPLFASYTDFRNALEGKGMLGPMLTAMGVQPITWNPAVTKKEMKKLFKTESKIFSIYAEGVVPGLQREARVRIHAVVDMRAALDWKQKIADDTATAQGSTPPPAPAEDETAPVDEDFVKELTTNPFGSVIYYRVD